MSLRRKILIGTSLSLVSIGIHPNEFDDCDINTSYYLLPSDFKLENIKIPPPPINDSEEAKLVMEMQKNRTEKIINQIKLEALNPLPLFWACAKLNHLDYPNEAIKLKKAIVDAEAVIIQFKRKFNRTRPSMVLPCIETVVEIPPYSSYPSGHAAQSVVMARFFSELVPHLSDQLNLLAHRIGRNRELAGLHYPSDTNAGFELGKKLADIMLPI